MQGLVGPLGLQEAEDSFICKVGGRRFVGRGSWACNLPTTHWLWPETFNKTQEPGLSEAHGHTGYSGHLETSYVTEALTLEAGSGWHSSAHILAN